MIQDQCETSRRVSHAHAHFMFCTPDSFSPIVDPRSAAVRSAERAIGRDCGRVSTRVRVDGQVCGRGLGVGMGVIGDGG